MSTLVYGAEVVGGLERLSIKIITSRDLTSTL